MFAAKFKHFLQHNNAPKNDLDIYLESGHFVSIIAKFNDHILNDELKS